MNPRPPRYRWSVHAETGTDHVADTSVGKWVAKQRRRPLYARIMRVPSLRTAASRLAGFVDRAPEGSPVRAILGPARLRFGSSFKVSEVLRAVEALQSAGITFWVAGGWGIEALTGRRQSRTHHDLDVVIDDFDCFVDAARQALAPVGYRMIHARSLAVWMPDRCRLQNDDRMCTIDLLSIDWCRLAEGLGIAAARDGQHSRLLSTVAFSNGSLKGRLVPCLSGTVQLLYHTGFKLRPEHESDVMLVRSLLEPVDGKRNKGDGQ